MYRNTKRNIVQTLHCFSLAISLAFDWSSSYTDLPIPDQLLVFFLGIFTVFSPVPTKCAEKNSIANLNPGSLKSLLSAACWSCFPLCACARNVTKYVVFLPLPVCHLPIIVAHAFCVLEEHRCNDWRIFHDGEILVAFLLLFVALGHVFFAGVTSSFQNVLFPIFFITLTFNIIQLYMTLFKYSDLIQIE